MRDGLSSFVSGSESLDFYVTALPPELREAIIFSSVLSSLGKQDVEMPMIRQWTASHG